MRRSKYVYAARHKGEISTDMLEGTRSVDDEKCTEGSNAWMHKDEKMCAGESRFQRRGARSSRHKI